jgi:hypothetical protein
MFRNTHVGDCQTQARVYVLTCASIPVDSLDTVRKQLDCNEKRVAGAQEDLASSSRALTSSAFILTAFSAEEKRFVCLF